VEIDIRKKMKANSICAFCVLLISLLFSACAAPSATQIVAETPSVATSPTPTITTGPQFDNSQAALLEAEVEKNYPNLLSVLVQKNGVTLYEKYFQGQTAQTYTHVFSVTKSVTSALIGIALDKGMIKSLDQPLADFLPEYFADPALKEKKKIAIRQALTMTAGITPTDDSIESWMSSPDWFVYALSQPLVSPPGKKFAYNTGMAHLLSGVITHASGMSTRDFADRYLFGPLDIKNYRWDTDPKGYFGGGHLLYLTPRDMAKFGYLYLQHGKWNGTRVVPESWVADSTRSQVPLDDFESYGYLWWIFNVHDDASGKNLPAYAARGLGGQHIIVVPERSLVVVLTCDPALRSRDRSDPSEMVGKYILKAVQ
jgi:CubicO group peptidase (beta-lactamase class C family)